MNKVCPLLRIAYCADIHARGQQGADCIENNCAWWEDVLGSCVIVSRLVATPEQIMRRTKTQETGL